MEFADLPPQQQIYTLQSNNHIVAATPRTETNPPTERTQSIFIKPIIIVLLQTKPTKFPITHVLLRHFRVILVAVSLSH